MRFDHVLPPHQLKISLKMPMGRALFSRVAVLMAPVAGICIVGYPTIDWCHARNCASSLRPTLALSDHGAAQRDAAASQSASPSMSVWSGLLSIVIRLNLSVNFHFQTEAAGWVGADCALATCPNRSLASPNTGPTLAIDVTGNALQACAITRDFWSPA